MEVTGFKKTEAGLIPDDWAVCYLPDILRFRSGKAHEQYITDDGDHICVNSKFISTDGKIRKYASANFCPAKTGDILMVMSDLPNGKALAKAFLVQGKQSYAVNQRVCALTPYKDESKYLYYVLNRNPYFLKFDDGVSQTHLLNPVFSKCVLPIPPTKAEQQAIAEALSDMDATIEALEQLITKKRYIKQGTMQELLTGKRRLPGFSGAWVEKKLGDISHIKTGSRNNQDKVEDGAYPFFVRSADVERINSYSYNCEAILVPGEGNIGNIFHYIHGKFDVHQRVYAITQFVKDTWGKYVYLYMAQNFGAHAMQNSVKATVDSLRLPTFQNFAIKMPIDIEEQKAVAACLTDMIEELNTLETKLTKARYLKQGMMQQLLTGRIRLI